jgi:hypothetical protein
MRITWVQIKRWPGWPWWAVVLPALWLVLGGIVLLLAPRAGLTAPFCLFKRLTGCPCPSCGFTRGILSVLHGHPMQAWLYNPLLFSFLGMASAVVFFRVLTGRSPRLLLNRVERAAVWVTLSVLFVANWLYVIRYVG